jgi:hypothetical protein
MTRDHLEHLENSRQKLIDAIGQFDDLTLVLPHGNIGDHLIHAGTKQLLAGLTVREISVRDVPDSSGDTALVGGSGGWCRAYHGLPECLPLLETHFNRVIVLPSSFDTSVDSVKRALSSSRALIFARERISYEQIRPLCNAALAHDCAFFFDYGPYQQVGEGVLTAFRTDQESAFQTVHSGNQDISVVCHSLDEWLSTISRHALIRTDRAHVMIAGALLGKRVEYLASSYHKLPAIVDYSLRDFPVTRLPRAWAASLRTPGAQLTDSGHLRVLAENVTASVPPDATFMMVDDIQIGSFPLGARTRVPFLERDGIYWGAPADNETAINELERMRSNGVTFAVFPWSSFWWFDYYPKFFDYLHSKYRRVIDNDSLVVFDIGTPDNTD